MNDNNETTKKKLKYYINILRQMYDYMDKEYIPSLSVDLYFLSAKDIVELLSEYLDLLERS